MGGFIKKIKIRKAKAARDAAEDAQVTSTPEEPVEDTQSKTASMEENHTESGQSVESAPVDDQPIIDESDHANLAGHAREEEELAKLRAEVAATQDKYLRALADFENYKKRAIKDRSELLKYQGEQVLLDMLSVADNLELALQYKDADPAKVQSGLELIYKDLCSIFARWEVKSESGIGKEFDPSKHAAISKVPAHDCAPGTIVSELKKAFFYKDKLLRVGEVVVATEPPAAELEPEQG